MNQAISSLVMNLADYRFARRIMIPQLEKEIYHKLYSNRTEELQGIKQKQYDWVKALVASVARNLDRGIIQKNVLKGLVRALVKGAFHENREDFRRDLDHFKSTYGVDAPTFFVISPTQRCNLHCEGCYAGSHTGTSPTLEYHRIKQFISEFYREANGRFIVLSGGEPLMYKSEGKTLLDLARQFPDMFFMFYSNGTLINQTVADKFAGLGNLIPCISVEGFERETDQRRGRGVYKRILGALSALRNAGVPIVLSVTSTSKNADLLLKDEFYDFYFRDQGASYMWQFQFMPIGRGREVFDLMPTPQQRISLYRKWEHLLQEKEYCVADFWNSGVLTEGCIAYGRRGGYLYIDWNGNVMPCVFVPYVVDNIIRAQDEGRNLASILKSPMLVNGRNWQHRYALDHLDHPQNMLMPCSIRDHYKNFRANIITEENRGEDPNSDAILKDIGYYQRMIEYDKELSGLTTPIWQEEYLKQSVEV
jgi:MoaA/NifB/PqqE/SkfB family radical SAM enzyme